MPYYNNGKIYKIYNTITDDIYIGATTRLLSDRMQNHIVASKDKKLQHLTLYKCFNEHGVSNFYIELIEKYNCNSRGELYAKEGGYIRELNPSLNRFLSGRTRAEYYKDNKVKIKEQRAQYRENNKDLIKEQNKRYRENNKDLIKEHKKQKRENNNDLIKERGKQYYENNIDTIKAKKKQYHEQKKQEKNNTV